MKIYQFLSWFFAIAFVLSIVLFFVGLASMKMGLNWKTQDDMDRAEKCIFIAAIGLLVSFPLTTWFDKKVRNERKRIADASKSIDPADRPYWPTSPKMPNCRPYRRKDK